MTSNTEAHNPTNEKNILSSGSTQGQNSTDAKLIIRKIGGTKVFKSPESLKGQPLRAIQHPRLHFERGGDKTEENIYLDHGSTVSHVNVSSSADVSELRALIKTTYPELNGCRVFYISVGQMMHFKIERKLQV
jgi:hypothetical protein